VDSVKSAVTRVEVESVVRREGEEDVEEEEEGNTSSDEDKMEVVHFDAANLEQMSGAETASEIFRHLQVRESSTLRATKVTCLLVLRLPETRRR